MRPREIPAEAANTAPEPPASSVASMRPREIPAEALRDIFEPIVGAVASMRPREIPAEAGPPGRLSHRRPARFNEAAGDPRGSRDRRLREREQGGASMRPREIPAEAVHCSQGPGHVAVLQ